VTVTLSNNVDAMSIVFPGFVYDGQRNTSIVLSPDFQV
jgi:hypothetical protein